MKHILCLIALLAALPLNIQFAQAQSSTSVQARPRSRPRPFLINPPNLPVVGGGTFGQLTMWTGFNNSDSVIGDSVITQTKLGLIGIGTTSPTSIDFDRARNDRVKRRRFQVPRRQRADLRGQ